MITQILKTSLLMKQEENLILRQNDVGNDIVFLFDAKLDDITSAEFRLIKPDNTFVILTGTVEENTATFTITEQCCAIPGRCHFNLRLINSSSNIYTYISNCIIDINLNLEDAIESTAEANGYTFPDDFALKKEIPDTDEFATKNYVDNAIDTIPVYNPPNYSTVEQDTGLRWIDNKHIYQKTFNITFTSSFLTVDLTALNIDKVVKTIEGGVCDASGGFIPFGYESAVSAYTSSATSMSINNSYYGSKPSGHATIFYTKTTDTTNI